MNILIENLEIKTGVISRAEFVPATETSSCFYKIETAGVEASYNFETGDITPEVKGKKFNLFIPQQPKMVGGVVKFVEHVFIGVPHMYNDKMYKDTYVIVAYRKGESAESLTNRLIKQAKSVGAVFPNTDTNTQMNVPVATNNSVAQETVFQ